MRSLWNFILGIIAWFRKMFFPVRTYMTGKSSEFTASAKTSILSHAVAKFDAAAGKKKRVRFSPDYFGTFSPCKPFSRRRKLQ
jgi:hypothetical protein